MSMLYQAHVTGDYQFRHEGLPYYVQHGEPQTVSGTPMVRLSHGVLVPAEGWHADRAAAVREAADRIESLGRRLLDQAERLRADADKVVTT